MDHKKLHKFNSSYTTVDDFILTYPIFQYEFVKEFESVKDQEFILQILPQLVLSTETVPD